MLNCSISSQTKYSSSEITATKDKYKVCHFKVGQYVRIIALHAILSYCQYAIKNYIKEENCNKKEVPLSVMLIE